MSIFILVSRPSYWLSNRYMNDAKIVESGRHDELLKLQGEYARIWTLQAQAFL